MTAYKFWVSLPGREGVKDIAVLANNLIDAWCKVELECPGAKYVRVAFAKKGTA